MAILSIMWPVLALLGSSCSGCSNPVPPPGIFSVPLQDCDTLTWSLDYPRRTVTFEVHVAHQPKQWFAVGFSDRGMHTDADFCILWTDWREHMSLQDTWSDGKGDVALDEQQDCADFKFTHIGDTTVFSFTRQFDSCDKHDYVIEEGTTHIVWSRGAGPLFSVNGLNVKKSSDSGMVRTQLLKNVHADHPMGPDVWHLDALAEQVQVPRTDTTYWCHVLKLPDTISVPHHLVQAEPVIQKGNEPLVHHMLINHCEAPVGEDIPLYRGICDDPDRPPATQICKKVLAAWAMGAKPFSYPKEAGLPIGGANFSLYVMLEVHYNNPKIRSDWVDSSGIRIHLTKTLRRYDAALIELGLEFTDKMAIPPAQAAFELSGYCLAECTGIALPAEGIVIFGSQLHTHLTGVRVLTRHIRDGRELPELNRDNHYSTHFQEIRILKKPSAILPAGYLKRRLLS